MTSNPVQVPKRSAIKECPSPRDTDVLDAVARGCLHLSERKKKQPAIQIKKGDRSLPKIN